MKKELFGHFFDSNANKALAAYAAWRIAKIHGDYEKLASYSRPSILRPQNADPSPYPDFEDQAPHDNGEFEYGDSEPFADYGPANDDEFLDNCTDAGYDDLGMGFSGSSQKGHRHSAPFDDYGPSDDDNFLNSTEENW